MHHIDLDTPWEEIWQAMETLVRQGKVIYVGSSNFAGWNIVQAQESARARHFQGLVSEQSLYNLLERRIELEVLPAGREYGVGVIPWSPLMRGVLGGILRKEREGRSASETTQRVLAEHRDQIERYESFCDELGSHPADVGIAWLLEQPGVTAPIIGPRTLDQLESNVRALAVTLDDAALSRLDEIFPPVGPAPQAYAW
jgi:aryl-alcohol dehydrogenase-like predicted oxidoreductase